MKIAPAVLKKGCYSFRYIEDFQLGGKSIGPGWLCDHDLWVLEELVRDGVPHIVEGLVVEEHDKIIAVPIDDSPSDIIDANLWADGPAEVKT